jgi:hypothetical protein
MAKALKPQNSRVRGIVFELDRLELAEGQQCELKGRWFGVRGRRFLRPALTLIGDGWRTRLLADLAHKPWDAEEGEPWEAAFEGELDDVELLEAELTVAPDITITLPLPRAGARRSARKSPRNGAPARHSDSGRPPADELAEARARASTRELREARSELRQLRGQLARADAELQRTADQLDAALGELQQAARERDSSREERDQARAELGATQQALEAMQEESRDVHAARDRAHAELEAAREAGEQAVSERDVALSAKTQARSERDAALAGRAQAANERDASLARCDSAVSERDAAVKARDDAAAERDAALAARASAESELATLQRENERLQSELAEHQAAHGAALVMRQATRARPGVHYPAELSRAAPLVGVLVILVALALLIVLVAARGPSCSLQARPGSARHRWFGLYGQSCRMELGLRRAPASRLRCLCRWLRCANWSTTRVAATSPRGVARIGLPSRGRCLAF